MWEWERFQKFKNLAIGCRCGGGGKLGIKNDFQVSNLDDCVDGVPPTETESTRE